MDDTWTEVSQAKDENRYELVLSGADVSKRISKTGLDESIFSLVNLNFLEISKTILSTLPDHVGKLVNLTQLVLHSNELESIPKSIGRLIKLKTLDLSRNHLKELPDEVCLLIQMQHLNLSCNNLSKLPTNLSLLSKLITISVSRNELQDFPLDCNREFVFLTEIHGKNNKIQNIPSSINNISNLKILDLEENEINQVPGELGDCGKLKDLHLRGNALKDRRLKKMVEQCHTKQVLEYVRVHCPKESESSEGNKKVNKSKSKKGSKSKIKESDENEQIQDQLQVLHLTDSTPVVIVMDSVKEVRPHILCCVLKNVDLESGNKFKKFIALQSKLHDNECEKRNSATIATHDLDKINGNLIYDAQAPEQIRLIPLLSQKDVTAQEFYGQLRKEADALRKEKKRNTFSGIHKYLYLLDGKPLYPCLKLEKTGDVISFPPITNSEISKITLNTRHILVEVTSSVSLNICKKILDSLLLSCVQMELGKNEQEQQQQMDRVVPNTLTVEQVKIVDKIGQLRAVYPSRTDLQLDGIKILRNFD